MMVRRLCGLSVLITLTGCQMLAGLKPTPATSRYLQRDLTVAWSERQYWSPAPPGNPAPWRSMDRLAPAATRPLPPAGEVARPPAALPWPTATLACRQGSC